MVINDSQQKKEENPHESGDDASLQTETTSRARYPYSDPNAGTGDPTDGRKRYDWHTRYPPAALKEIFWESIFLVFVFLCYFEGFKE